VARPPTDCGPAERAGIITRSGVFIKAPVVGKLLSTLIQAGDQAARWHAARGPEPLISHTKGNVPQMPTLSNRRKMHSCLLNELAERSELMLGIAEFIEVEPISNGQRAS
jgi:hypothetical protein